MPEMPYAIVIVPKGRLGNVMFQYLLAWELNRRLDYTACIYGPGLPEWGIDPLAPEQQAVRPYRLKGHLFDLDQATYAVRSGLADAIVVEGWGMRMEYYADWKALLLPFQTILQPEPVSNSEILINVRAEDIESGKHPGYYPLSFDFYDQVIRHARKQPVFMGQVHHGEYAAALRSEFPHARFLESDSPMLDFVTIRGARCLAISTSTFAWLAAWSSTVAECIHYPVVGIFDPRRGVQNLMPVGDPRYVFWTTQFPSMQARLAIPGAATWAVNCHGSRRLTRPESQAIAIGSFAFKLSHVALAQLKTGIPQISRQI